MSWSWISRNASVESTVATFVPTCFITACAQLTVDWTVCVHIWVCRLLIPWWPHFLCGSGWPCPFQTKSIISIWWCSQAGPSGGHCLKLMCLISGLLRTPITLLETLWGCWCNTPLFLCSRSTTISVWIVLSASTVYFCACVLLCIYFIPSAVTLRVGRSWMIMFVFPHRLRF